MQVDLANCLWWTGYKFDSFVTNNGCQFSDNENK